MKALIFDTETTGKADFRASHEAEWQPYLVQLGAMLIEYPIGRCIMSEGGQALVLVEINLLVFSRELAIPEEASRIHGFTTQCARDFGISSGTVLGAFYELAEKADVFVAHNIEFDLLVMRAACFRAGISDPFGDNARFHCTMKTMTEVCKLPGPYGWKWPSLEEAHRHLFNEFNIQAHNAMEDVRACARIFLKQVEMGMVKP